MKEYISKNAYHLGVMDSGRLYIDLTSKIGWDDFPHYAENLIKSISGKITNRIDSFDIRIYQINIGNGRLRLVYQDFPELITLEAENHEGDEFINLLR